MHRVKVHTVRRIIIFPLKLSFRYMLWVQRLPPMRTRWPSSCNKPKKLINKEQCPLFVAKFTFILAFITLLVRFKTIVEPRSLKNRKRVMKWDGDRDVNGTSECEEISVFASATRHFGCLIVAIFGIHNNCCKCKPAFRSPELCAIQWCVI